MVDGPKFSATAVLASRVGGVHTRAHEEVEVSPVEGR